MKTGGAAMIFKGNFLYTPALGELTVREGSTWW